MTVRGFLIIERQNARVVFKGRAKTLRYKRAYCARVRGRDMYAGGAQGARIY